MRFYNRQHRCGIDLHVKSMYICIVDAAGQVVHRNVKSTPKVFLEIVAAYRDDLVVAAECMFSQILIVAFFTNLRRSVETQDQDRTPVRYR